jgi:hypothetical protein
MINKRLLKKIWLKHDELPLAVIRSSWLSRFWSWFLGFFLIILAVFLMYFLLLELAWLGLTIFSVLVVIGLFIIFRTYWSWYFTGWILTDLRLIDIYQQGFLGRETSEVIYSQLKEIYAKSSGFLSILGLGDLYLKVGSEKVKFKLGAVRGYDRAISEISLQQENYQKNLLDSKESEAVRLLDKIRKKIGKTAFEELIAD